MSKRQKRLSLEIGAHPQRLAHCFGSSSQFWMGLQNDFDLDMAADTLGDRLDIEVRPMLANGAVIKEDCPFPFPTQRAKNIYALRRRH